MISFPFFQIHLTHFTYLAFEKKYLVHLLTFIARFDTGLTPMAQTSGMTHHRGLINR